MVTFFCINLSVILKTFQFTTVHQHGPKLAIPFLTQRTFVSIALSFTNQNVAHVVAVGEKNQSFASSLVFKCYVNG